ncbi:MAG: helix-turn-helix transcriptional regulator [Chloroflexota bacterium]|nr:helix-turn-helix transcriptional regulator [Chloroflexota bacterium]
MDSNGLGDLIRRRREELNLTQEELARRIGSTRPYISQIESGTRKWPRRYVSALAEALDLSEQQMEAAAGRLRPLVGARRLTSPPPPSRLSSKTMLRASNDAADTQAALGHVDSLLEALEERLDDRARAALRTLLEAIADPVALRGIEAETDAWKVEAVATETHDESVDRLAASAQSLASSLDKLVPGWSEPGSTEGADLLRLLFRKRAGTPGGAEEPGR